MVPHAAVIINSPSLIGHCVYLEKYLPLVELVKALSHTNTKHKLKGDNNTSQAIRPIG